MAMVTNAARCVLATGAMALRVLKGKPADGCVEGAGACRSTTALVQSARSRKLSAATLLNRLGAGTVAFCAAD